MAENLSTKSLWFLCGDGWTLPVRAERSESVYRVELCSMPMLELQKRVISDRLNKLGIPNGSWWIVERSQWEGKARPCPHVDPEEVVQWNRIREIGPAAVGEDPNEEHVYQEMFNRGFIKSPMLAKTVMRAWAKVAMDVMLLEERPVTLGFVDLLAMPMRPGWMAMSLTYLAGHVHNMFGRGRPLATVDTALRNDRIWERIMTEPRLFFVNSKCRRVLWSVSVTHRKTWWRAVIAAEEKRGKGLRIVSYWRSLCQTVKRLTPHARRFLAAYCSEIGKPMVAIPKAESGRAFFASQAEKFKISAPDLAFPIYPSVAFRAEGGPSGPVLQTGTTPGILSELHHLRSEMAEVREGRSPENGVPVLDAAQDVVQGLGVLDSGTDRRDT